MKITLLVLATCVGLALAGSFVGKPATHKVADKTFLARQKQIFDLLDNIYQESQHEEIIKVAHEFNLETDYVHFKNEKVVKEFSFLYKHGMLPRGEIFSIFYDKMRTEAIALFHMFFCAKDYETFYKTAAWARQHMNEGMFVYALTVAVLHREDTRGIVLPAPYEIYPYYFVSSEVIDKAYRMKMQGGMLEPKLAEYYGIEFADDTFYIYSNYSGWYVNWNDEQKLSYFTEDIGLNSYYYYFHADYPFWMGGEDFGLLKDSRGELYYYTHQQLLARYYMERLTNGLGEIPSFSWESPMKTGYYPSMKYPNGFKFPVRTNDYDILTEENVFDLEFVEDVERWFRSYAESTYFKMSSGKLWDMTKPESFDVMGNLFQLNNDAVGGKYHIHNEKFYEIIARTLLGASRDPITDYKVGPSALEQFETSLRDPMFWQLYKRVVQYFIYFKRDLKPYTIEELHYPGVKVDNVEISDLKTFFDYYDFDMTNGVYFSKSELAKPEDPERFVVRQPRLNHNHFDMKIKVTSEKAVESVVRIFLGPKYDSFGNELSFEENKYNFVELDTFIYSLTAGENTIERHCVDFHHVVKDRTSIHDLYKKVNSAISGGEAFTLDMTEGHNGYPLRLLLPKGTKGGFPFQFYVIVSPHVAPKISYGTGFENGEWSGVGTGARYLDGRALGYPFDRTIVEAYFYQPNMYVKDVKIYHVDEEYVYNMAKPSYYHQWYTKYSKTA